MTHSDAPLPDFERPPVTEVVLASGFAGVELTTASIMDFRYRVLGSSMDKMEERPPYLTGPEIFDGTGRQALGLSHKSQ